MGHGHTDCTVSSFCINCGAQHRASDSACPHYVLRKEILILQTKQKISFREAKARVRVSYASQGKRYTFHVAPNPGPNTEPVGQPLPPPTADPVVLNDHQSTMTSSHTLHNKTTSQDHIRSSVVDGERKEGIIELGSGVVDVCVVEPPTCLSKVGGGGPVRAMIADGPRDGETD